MSRTDRVPRRAASSFRLRAMFPLALVALGAGCSGEPLSPRAEGDPSGAAPPVAVSSGPATTAGVAPAATTDLEVWRQRMARNSLPKDGCFQATHPSFTWQEVPCETPPNIPLSPVNAAKPVPETVGSGFGDFQSKVSGLIAWSEGSFPFVSGVTGVTDVLPPPPAMPVQTTTNAFTLQINSNQFTTGACDRNSVAACRGWQQFVFWNGGPKTFVAIQYWLVNYASPGVTAACPAGFFAGPASTNNQNSCFRNSAGSVSFAQQPISNLGHLVLTGAAGSSDILVLSLGTGTLYAVSQSSLLGLNQQWNASEFNIFGYGSGSQVTFNTGSTIAVRTITNSAVHTTAAPSRLTTSTTAETNNLSTVGAACLVGGASPGIQFTESNAAMPVAQACPVNLQSAAVCGRGSTGIRCGRSNGTTFGTASTWQSSFSNNQSWNAAPYYSGIRFADINNDGLADVCGRGPSGIDCALSTGTGFGGLNVWSSSFRDAAGFNPGAQYYTTIKLGDLNGDGKADVCGRNAGGMICGLSNGTTSFEPTSTWLSGFSDAAGFGAAKYYSTIHLADINGDGKADICGRMPGGIFCAKSTGKAPFGALTSWASTFSDANHWGDGPWYYSTIQFPDLNGDGKADVCGRGTSGVGCSLSTGSTFSGSSIWMPTFSDAAGFNLPQYYSTIQYADINGDGKADICGRGIAGMYCARSDGTTFGTLTLWNSSFNDSAGWNQAQYYSTIRLVDVNEDGKADLCGRGIGGMLCALSTGSSFGTLTTWLSDFSDANGWTTPDTYSTIGYLNE